MKAKWRVGEGSGIVESAAAYEQMEQLKSVKPSNSSARAIMQGSMNCVYGRMVELEEEARG
jgi:hypothetical protein